MLLSDQEGYAQTLVLLLELTLDPRYLHVSPKFEKLHIGHKIFTFRSKIQKTPYWIEDIYIRVWVQLTYIIFLSSKLGSD